jgi:DNA-binding Lrp family transcriptional regulator
MEMKENDLRIFTELLRGSRRSDRELAKAARVSQPTVTRIRTKLEKQGFIREYTVIPDLMKMGYELLAFTFLSFSEDRPEHIEEAREWVKKQPCVIFTNDGEGMGMNSVMLSIHKDYTSYTSLITRLKRDWQPNLRTEQTFLVSLERSDLAIKQFSFRSLLANETCPTDRKNRRRARIEH